MQVTYMNGAGNDFMVLDARGLTRDFSRLAVTLCALRHADGLLAVGEAEDADFEMIFYNSDGTRGEMCGNGARCIARFACDQGIVGDHMVFRTLAGNVEGWRVTGSQYRVALNIPSVLDLHRKGDVAYVELGDPGVPHAVAEYKGDLWQDRDSLREEMRRLRFDPAFPKGANVNYYQWLGDAEVRMLTFERGVEDYTLACGTGTGSTACALFRAGKLPGGILTAHNPGGTLRITLTHEGQNITGVFLEGPAQTVQAYELEIDN